jgi:hypothetical protein
VINDTAKDEQDRDYEFHPTWSDKEDDYLYWHGYTVLWVAGRSKAIQNFVEKLSYEIGSKCDFSFTAGRAHIDVDPKFIERAFEAISNQEFMEQFLVPYSEESYDDETYFEILR